MHVDILKLVISHKFLHNFTYLPKYWISYFSCVLRRFYILSLLFLKFSKFGSYFLKYQLPGEFRTSVISSSCTDGRGNLARPARCYTD